MYPKIKHLMILGALMFCVSRVWAGPITAGNGGHGVMCTDDYSMTTVLDFYETEKLYSIHLDRRPFGMQDGAFVAPTRNLVQKVYREYLKTISELAQGQPELQLVISDVHNQYFSYVGVAGYRLALTPSWPLVQIPKGCTIEQLGVRVVSQNQQNLIYIRDELFGQMNYVEIAGLALHEMLHEYFHPNQVATESSQRALRQFVGYVAASVGYNQSAHRFYLKNKEAALRLIQTKEPQKFEP